MKARISFLSVLVLLLMMTISTTAQAVMLDFKRGGADFRGDVLASVGEEIILDVVLSNILPDGVAAFSFDVNYDTSEVSLSTYTPNTPLPSPLNAELFGAADITTPGVILNVNGGAFTGKTDVDSITVATLNFMVTGLMDDGVPDFGFAFRSGQGISDGEVNLEPLVIAGADLVPIPEPASMLLIGSGLIGLFGVSRRRKTE